MTMTRRGFLANGSFRSVGVLGSFFFCLMASAVDLSGVWSVRGTNFTGEAKLPGTLASAHLGRRWTVHDFTVTMDLVQSEALVQEYQYVGPATYVRTVELSAADCRGDHELFLERVMWKSEAFFDGVSLGTRDSLATPHVHSVPRDLVKPGRHEIRIVVDNSCFYNFSRQSHAYGPNMQAVWNGVLGKVELRRAHPLRAAKVFARCPAGRHFEVRTAAKVKTVTVDGLEVRGWDQRGDTVTVWFGGEPIYWNELHPRLYTVRLTAADGFRHAIRFGFRTVGTHGRAITLNGNAVFIRGNVENANFALDGTPWMDKAQWRGMLSTLKDEDGINTVRFHTWTPPQAAFDAADELGVFLQPEAGVWTDSWMASGDEVGNGKPVDGFVRRELKAICDAYGNSPSLLSLSIGNELGNSNFETMSGWIAEMRRYEPRCLHYASSARTVNPTDDISLSHRVPSVGMSRERLFPKTDWDYEDAYSKADVPTIAHEIGQWPVYPVWDDLFPRFTGTMRPWNITRHYDTAVKKDALRFTNEYHAASAKLNRLIYKEEVESFLRTPSCAGLQLLEVQDYTGQAEALVGWRGPFYELKPGFAELPKFATVWGPVSYLARFAKFTWTVGETFSAKLQIRNLTDRTIPAGTAYPYSLGATRGDVRLPADVAPGAVATVGEVGCMLTKEMMCAKQTLTFGSNSWNFWVYPEEGKCPMPEGVTLTDDPEVMKRTVRAGGTVLYTGRSARCGKGTFKPVYWSARWFPAANTITAALGTWFDRRHPAFDGFVTDDFTDWQWYSLAEGGLVHALEGLPREYRPIGLSVNDFHFSDFAATIFEVTACGGRLLVCGYDLEKDDPAAKRLRASLAAYLMRPPAKGVPAVSEDWLERAFDVREKTEDLSGAVYDVTTNWTGRAFATELRGFAPVTGFVRIDFTQPLDGLTSGRGLLDGRVFEVPFTEARGAKTSVSIPIVREDMLDGHLDLSVNLMTGKALGVDRIRVIPK